jgi:GNAT superfamily N-acetyltransferase
MIKLSTDNLYKYDYGPLTINDVRNILLLKYNIMETRRGNDKLTPVRTYQDIPFDIKYEILDIMIQCKYNVEILIKNNNDIIGFLLGNTDTKRDYDKNTMRSLIYVYNEAVRGHGMKEKSTTFKKEDLRPKDIYIFNKIASLTKIMKFGYLDILCVDDKYQNKGFGHGLIDRFINKCENKTMFLFTSTNMNYQFYENIGCKAIYTEIKKNRTDYIFGYSKNGQIMKLLDQTAFIERS